jgi:hypothetical protein
MAKAQFHKNQRVYVKPVGTWAPIERVVPHWAKGLEEPLRIFYDVGLGREFGAEELQAEESAASDRYATTTEKWRIARGRNKWQAAEECTRHPFPGTFPIVMTGEAEWGGWRVPGAEYDLDPYKAEQQARLIASAPQLAQLAKDMHELVRLSGEELPDSVVRLAHAAEAILAQCGVVETEPA